MKHDPYTLVVALDQKVSIQSSFVSVVVLTLAQATATGELYEDDGKSFDYQTKNAYLRRLFQFQNAELKSSAVNVQQSQAHCRSLVFQTVLTLTLASWVRESLAPLRRLSES